ncbi:RNA polymerase sigma factor FliA [Chryseobacterium aquaeductus]|uniref:RNA polymerase sigma factor FliA n=1 Tax=Chryseobacterium aquaeductus TaxID=2675056 RepID=A0A9N8MIT1_9FLAO|nr:sigma factor-like helix-turn-helix DNA-binding protein [Chryseobacterium aquaeductus]CAA7332566.1 RNA polymerase sigma factor FliA [Chryseobacterium potabilaquae]CAD7823744.1 RNA polymerase sigma factor FliA [Chryseobacterium aquaeductus]
MLYNIFEATQKKFSFLQKYQKSRKQSTEMNNSSTEKNHVLAYDFTREELLKSIDSLPLHHRSVFNLYFIENHSHQEIAKLLGINCKHFKSHLLRSEKICSVIIY